MLTLTISIRKASARRWAASLNGELLCTAKTPLLTAARVLQTRGIPSETPLVMLDQRGIVSLRSTVGAAAGLTVIERDDPRGRIEPHFAKFELHPLTAWKRARTAMGIPG